MPQMIGRLYTVKQSPPPPDMPKGWTRYKIEDGTVRTYFHEAPKIS